MIDDPQAIDIAAIKLKALTFSWAFMFARSMFQTEDMDVQHELLNRVAELLDEGTRIPTVHKHCGTMGVASLRSALEHRKVGGDRQDCLGRI